jgi:hypothetical protein
MGPSLDATAVLVESAIRALSAVMVAELRRDQGSNLAQAAYDAAIAVLAEADRTGVRGLAGMDAGLRDAARAANGFRP